MGNYDELYHYGIPGMKWGVRRFQSNHSGVRPRRASNRKLKKEAKKQIKKLNRAQRERAANTDITKLSDNELRSLNDRIRNENAYKDSVKNKKIASNGKSFVGNVLSSAGTKVATATLTGVGVGLAMKWAESNPALGTTVADFIKKAAFKK